jgi:hypothetical protein
MDRTSQAESGRIRRTAGYVIMVDSKGFGLDGDPGNDSGRVNDGL